MVQELEVGWPSSDHQEHNYVEMLLGKLRNLRTLKMRGGPDHTPFQHKYLATGSIASLSTVVLDMDDLTIEKLAEYMLLPRLTNVSIAFMNPSTHAVIPNFKMNQNSHVAMLNLEYKLHLPVLVVKALLTMAPKLESLLTNLPGEPAPYSRGEKLTTNVSPVSISKSLEPVLDTLTDLTLVDKSCQWPGHDGSQLDLSPFANPTRLEISSLCYFQPGRSRRHGIASFIPASLRSLTVRPSPFANFAYFSAKCIIKIVFGMETAICPEPHDTGTGKVLSIRSLPEGNEDTTWMMQLIARKQDGELPHLGKCTLEEQCGRWIRAQVIQITSTIQWQAPNAVTEGFEKVGIEFLASIRI